MSPRGLAVVVFGADSSERGTELLACQAAGFRVGGEPEFLNEVGRKTGQTCAGEVTVTIGESCERGVGGRQGDG